MLNNVVLVGRLADNPKLHELENGTKVCNITLAVMKPFRSMTTGEYGIDFIPVSLWEGPAGATNRWCVKGDTVGIKGRLSIKKQESNGINIYTIEVIGERIVFINLKSSQEGYVDPNVEVDNEEDEKSSNKK